MTYQLWMSLAGIASRESRRSRSPFREPTWAGSRHLKLRGWSGILEARRGHYIRRWAMPPSGFIRKLPGGIKVTHRPAEQQFGDVNLDSPPKGCGHTTEVDALPSYGRGQ